MRAAILGIAIGAIVGAACAWLLVHVIPEGLPSVVWFGGW